MGNVEAGRLVNDWWVLSTPRSFTRGVGGGRSRRTSAAGADLAGSRPPLLDPPDAPVRQGDRPGDDEEADQDEAGGVDVEVGHEAPEAAVQVDLARQQA